MSGPLVGSIWSIIVDCLVTTRHLTSSKDPTFMKLNYLRVLVFNYAINWFLYIVTTLVRRTVLRLVFTCVNWIFFGKCVQLYCSEKDIQNAFEKNIRRIYVNWWLDKPFPLSIKPIILARASVLMAIYILRWDRKVSASEHSRLRKMRRLSFV